MVNIGNPNPCLLVVSGRRHFFFQKKRRTFFEKARFGVPKPCLLRFSKPQAFFCSKKRHAFFEKGVFLSETDIYGQYLVNIGQYLVKCRYVPTYYTVLRTVRYGVLASHCLKNYAPIGALFNTLWSILIPF